MFFNFFFVTKLIKFLIFIQHTINFYDKNFHAVEIKYFDSFIYLKKKGKNIFKIKKNSVINNDSLSIYFPTFFSKKILIHIRWEASRKQDRMITNM